MSNVAAGLPFSAQVELASLGDGLKRWARLRILLKDADSPSYDGDAREQLTSLLEAARVDANEHAKALAAFYERNGAAVNDLISSALAADAGDSLAERAARDPFGELGEDPATSLGAKANEFAENGGVEFADDGLCGALFNLMMEAYVCCFGGVEASCGTLWGELYERHC